MTQAMKQSPTESERFKHLIPDLKIERTKTLQAWKSQVRKERVKVSTHGAEKNFRKRYEKARNIIRLFGKDPIKDALAEKRRIREENLHGQYSKFYSKDDDFDDEKHATFLSMPDKPDQHG